MSVSPKSVPGCRPWLAVSLAGLSIALLVVASTASAARVQRMTLREIRDQAASVLVAVVVSRETRLGENGRMVWTDYGLEVEDVWRADDEAGARTLSFAGGELGGREAGIAGVPHLEVGRRYVFFLLPSETPWATPTVGWSQGIFEVVPPRSADEPQVLVSYDGWPLELGAEGLRRGDPVRRGETWIEPADPGRRRRVSREAEPTVTDARGTVVPQPARRQEPAPLELRERPFAALEHLEAFVRGELDETDEAGEEAP